MCNIGIALTSISATNALIPRTIKRRAAEAGVSAKIATFETQSTRFDRSRQLAFYVANYTDKLLPDAA